MSRYTTNEEEKQLYPNLLGLTSPAEIAEAEFEGFLLAEIMLTEQLTSATHFDCSYICKIHRLALEELYSFAGKYRTVNMSKEVFFFRQLNSSQKACNYSRIKYSCNSRTSIRIKLH